VTQLLPLLDAIPPIGGKRGRPLRRPRILQGDCGYDSDPHRHEIRNRCIVPLVRRRNTDHGSGLGKTRWVVERTHSWLHQNRRLRVRFEKRADIHEAFLVLGCIMICWSALATWSPLC
jgi:transposase